MNEIMRRALADAMRPLVELVYKLEAKLAGKPHFEWGTVVSADPLRVKLDSHTTPLPDRPDSLVNGLREGDRVRVERQGTRVTIHGAGTGATTNWNIMTLSVGSGTLKWKRSGNLMEVRWAGTGSFATGATVLTSDTIPPDFRPDQNMRGTAALNANAAASLYVSGGGAVGIINSTGGSRTGGEGHCQWLI